MRLRCLAVMMILSAGCSPPTEPFAEAVAEVAVKKLEPVLRTRVLLSSAVLIYRQRLGAWPHSLQDLESFPDGDLLCAFEIDGDALVGQVVFQEHPDGGLEICCDDCKVPFTIVLDPPHSPQE